MAQGGAVAVKQKGQRSRKPRRLKPAAGTSRRSVRAATPPKLTAPVPAAIFPRQRLFDLLDRTRKDHRVIWVSAPGGAGKTSLATSYLSARKLPVLWYQVDASDGDIASLFYYMGLAAKQAAPRHKRPLPLLTPEYLADIPTFTRNFFRALYRRLPKHAVIVLDNYQDAPEDSPLHDVLQIAMGEVPEGLNLLVLSRAEPPAVLARLRLCDHAACLDWDKLQLTPEETRGICAIRLGHETVDARVLDTLHTRTQGWAAGVVLLLEQSRAGGSADTDKAPADQKLLFDYFAGEFLARAEPVVQDFLLKTALLPKFSVAMARSLTGLEHAQRILDDLARRNYFTYSVTGSEPGYLYHPLFREFLLARAKTWFEPAPWRALAQRAAELLEAGDAMDAAAQLLLDIEDHAGLARLILTQAETLARTGRLQTIAQWIAALPPELVNANAWFTYWNAVASLPFDPAGAREQLESAYNLFEKEENPVGMYLAWAGYAETFFFIWHEFSPLDRWMDKYRELTARYPECPSVEIEARVVYGMLNAVWWRRPKKDDMRYWAERAEALLVVNIDANLRTMIGISLLLFYMWWIGDYLNAERILRLVRPLATAERQTGPLYRIMWKLLETGFHAVTNNQDACLKTIQSGLQLAEESGIGLLNFDINMQGAYINLFQGNLEKADEFLAIAQEYLNHTAHMDSSHYHYILTWTALCRGDLPRAREHAQVALQRAEASGSPVSAAWCRQTLAHVQLEHGEGEQALENNRYACEWAEGAGSANTAYHGLLFQAYCALKKGDDESCAHWLRAALPLGKAQNYKTFPWIGWRRDVIIRLYIKALEQDIETGYVQELIREGRFTPPADILIPDNWPFPARLYTLGRFTIVLDDKPLSHVPGHKKPLDLLQALIALGGREVDEDRLAELFWPEAEGDAARQNLKINVHRLRKLLPENTLTWTDGKLSLDARQVWVDLWALERELNRLDPALTTPAPAVHSQRLFALCRGAFLAGNPQLWAVIARERIHNKIMRVLARAAETLEARDPAAAIPIYEQAIEIDPLRESLYQGLMRCYRALQRPADAEYIYRRCRDALKRELGLAPSPATEALRQVS